MATNENVDLTSDHSCGEEKPVEPTTSLLSTRADLQKRVRQERFYFESGEKTWRMLALRLEQIEIRQSIPAM